MRKWHVGGLVAVLLVITGVAFMSTRPPQDDRAASTMAFEEASVRMRIDISERKLYVEENGSVIESYNVAVGTARHPTPRGSYSVQHMIWNPRWVPPDSEWAKDEKVREPGDPKNPMGRVKIFFREPAYYIHGTAETGRLGDAASHGCIRMDPEHVAEVARYIMEHGGQPREESWFWRVLHFRRQERPIYLKNPIPIRIKA